MLSVTFFYCYAKCHNAMCHYTECRNAECLYAECRGAIHNTFRYVIYCDQGIQKQYAWHAFYNLFYVKGFVFEQNFRNNCCKDINILLTYRFIAFLYSSYAHFQGEFKVKIFFIGVIALDWFSSNHRSLIQIECSQGFVHILAPKQVLDRYLLYFSLELCGQNY